MLDSVNSAERILSDCGIPLSKVLADFRNQWFQRKISEFPESLKEFCAKFSGNILNKKGLIFHEL